jgi:hypothetical protein
LAAIRLDGFVAPRTVFPAFNVCEAVVVLLDVLGLPLLPLRDGMSA